VTDRKQKLAAVDAALSGMFKGLEARGVPEHLIAVVDQLEASALSAPAPTPAPVAPDAVRPSPEPPSTPEP
jgi:hypothetical protein